MSVAHMSGDVAKYTREVNGIVPGYSGHVPRARDMYGESAVGGLRKMYLKRPEWDKRCLECGTRHSEVEKGTCKFWIRWMQEAKEAETEAQEASAVNAVAEPPKPKEAAPEVEPVVEATKPATEVLADAKVEQDPQYAPFMPHLRRKELDETSPEKENVV